MTISTKARKLDMQGYVVLPKAAEADYSEYTEHIRPLTNAPDNPGKFHVAHLAPELFTRVIEYPEVRDLVRWFCGEHARLDNHFVFAYPGQGVSHNIHGGPWSESRSVYYHSQGDTFQTSNLKVGISLNDQRGLAVVPGSHKTDMRVRPCDVPKSELTHPRLRQADIIVFTDALIHGTVHTEQARAMLYYTFTPGHVCWAEWEDLPWHRDVPEQRRKFLRKPGMCHVSAEDRTISWKNSSF